MKLANKVVEALNSNPNGIMIIIGVVAAIYPDFKMPDKRNGGRVSSITKLARSGKYGFHIVTSDAYSVALDR